MKKSGWLISVLFVVMVFFLRQKTPPNLPLPAEYTSQGHSIKVSARMVTPPASDEEFWLLTSKEDKVFYVSVYHKQTLVRQFTGGKQLSSSASGRDFATSGEIRFNGVPYQANVIHVNQSNRSGWIVFVPVQGQKGATARNK